MIQTLFQQNAFLNKSYEIDGKFGLHYLISLQISNLSILIKDSSFEIILTTIDIQKTPILSTNNVYC